MDFGVNIVLGIHWQGKQLPGTEMTRFQEAMIMRELRDIHNVENEMMRLVDHCVGYTAILAAETLEAADHMDKSNIVRTCRWGVHGIGRLVFPTIISRSTNWFRSSRPKFMTSRIIGSGNLRIR